MEKKKAVMKIDSYSSKDGTLLLSVNDYGVKTMLKDLTDLCCHKYGGYIKIEASPPYRNRSTCVHGQNRHIHGHLQQIAEYTGYELDDIKDYVKNRALRRGYPTRQNPLTGEIKAMPTKYANTVEANYIIDELHQLAAELEIELDEGE